MSLLALGAVLESEFEYVIIDGNLESDPLAALDRAVRETGADVLGMTVMPGPQLSHAVPQSKELKARHPRLTIVWGGYFPTQHWDVALRADYVDYVVRGHGELVFRDLVRALSCEVAFVIGCQHLLPPVSASSICALTGFGKPSAATRIQAATRSANLRMQPGQPPSPATASRVCSQPSPWRSRLRCSSSTRVRPCASATNRTSTSLVLS